MPKYEFVNGKLIVTVDETNHEEMMCKIKKECKGSNKKASTMTKAELVELVKCFAKCLDIEIT